MKPVALIILDGWGVAPMSDGNGVARASTPNFNRYLASYPAMTLLASGESVGLAWGEMGNSEVGHLNLGCGRIFYQNLPRIDKAIEDETFFSNKVLLDAIEHARSCNSDLHLLGLVSDGKVHSVSAHCFAILDLCRRQKFDRVYIHAFLDGRDSPFNSGRGFIETLRDRTKDLGVGKIVSMHGRMFAMDRDNHWERVEKTYHALVLGKSENYFTDPFEAIQSSYDEKVFDEEFVPVVAGKEEQPLAVIKDNDAVVFFNYRADRARQLTHAFVDETFDKFNRGPKLNNLYFATMTEFEKGLPVKVIFPKENVKTSLAKILSERGYKQLHIAETEKYAHVTFFFSGGAEEPFDGEDRIVVPSPRVASYSERPEMSAHEVKENILRELAKEKHDFLVTNFANPDMVGHTGNIRATISAVETVDKCLGEIIDYIIAKNGCAVVVADHGNAEELLNLQTGEMDKEHSTNPVPCLIVAREFEGKSIGDLALVGNDLSLTSPVGLLSDVAPTILKLLGIQPPDEMTGRPLL